MMPDSYFMVHEGKMYLADTVKGVKSYMEFSERDEERMLDIYAERGKVSKRQIKKKMDLKQEWYLSAEEAVELGYADEVYKLAE
jgi:ATP-dependent protease ClpP protease subunit